MLADTHRRRPGDQDPLASPKARDFAVRDYRRWLLHEGPIKRFATSLVRGKTDLVIVAELMGHSRLDTTRQYSLPTEQDKADALNHLTTDH